MKRIISIILSLAMLFSISGLATIGAFAAETLETTTEGAYIVRTPDDFAKIPNDLTATYEIWADIDLTGKDVSIGDATTAFSGKIIGNLNGTGAKPTIKMAKTGASYLGLVNYLGAGEISNLKLTGTITGTSYMGSVAGYAIAEVTISDIDNYVEIISDNTTDGTSLYIGGILGSINLDKSGDSGTISCCNNFSNIGNVQGKNIGGILGYSNRSAISIDNCYNYGKILGYGNVGGILGSSANNCVKIDCCANFGDVGSNNTTTTAARVGGILGDGIAIINCCYNTGIVSGGIYVAGIVGYINPASYHRTIEIINSFNIGEVKNNNSNYKAYVGIVGGITNSKNVTLTATIENNYSVYAGSMSKNYPLYYSAGNGSGTLSATIKNNYYLNTKTSTEPTTFVEGTLPIALTADQMKTTDAFDGFDFEGEDAVWTIEEGYEYPQLISNPYKEVVDISDETITLESTFNSDDTYTVSWNKVDGATGYVVTVNGTPNNVTENSYTINGDNNTYTVKVKAVSDTSETSEAEITVNTLYAGGDGLTANTAYEIANARHFGNITETGFYKQIADIETITTPVAKFTGTYDGNGKTVKVNISKKGGYVGLFAELGDSTSTKGATVKNLTVTGSITATDATAAGGIAGVNNYKNTKIENCINNATVTSIVTDENAADTYAGGILGKSASSVSNCQVTVTNCENNGTITNDKGYAGGIVGWARSSISGCVNTAVVEGTSNVGGIAGMIPAGTITLSANKGKITCATNGKAGGILGQAGGSAVSTISKCYNAGPVTGPDSANVGGIVGLTGSQAVTISDCFNTIVLTRADASLLGAYGTGGATISDCYDIANPEMQLIGTGSGTLTATNVFVLNKSETLEYNGTVEEFTAEKQSALLSDTAVWTKLAGYDYPQILNLPYEKVYFVIEIKVGNGGEIDTDDIIYVNKNDTVDLTVTPDDGYAIKSMTFNNVVVPTATEKTEEFIYVTPQISDDSVIEISFYELTVIPSVTTVTAYTVPLSLSEDLKGKVDNVDALKGKAGALAFTKVDDGAGYEITDFGMMLSETAESYANGTAISAKAKAKGNYVYGILVYGKEAGTQYYLTPYVKYGNNEVKYGTPQQVTFANFND